jgi:hypothetical protein
MPLYLERGFQLLGGDKTRPHKPFAQGFLRPNRELTLDRKSIVLFALPRSSSPPQADTKRNAFVSEIPFSEPRKARVRKRTLYLLR